MKYVTIICLILLTACNQLSPVIPDSNPQYAILKHGQPKEKYYNFGFRTQQANLSPAELLKIDELINKQVITYNKTLGKTHGVINNTQNYYKQLVPVVDDTGAKWVLVVCVCSVDNFPDWRKQLIIKNDGGSCYFDLKINLSVGAAYDLNVNGKG